MMNYISFKLHHFNFYVQFLEPFWTMPAENSFHAIQATQNVASNNWLSL